nr:MAG: hypothetical protein [Bacteriophage sp.]
MDVKVVENILFKHKNVDIKIESLELDIKVLNEFDIAESNILRRKLGKIIASKNRIDDFINKLDCIEKKIIYLKYITNNPISLKSISGITNIKYEIIQEKNTKILSKFTALINKYFFVWYQDMPTQEEVFIKSNTMNKEIFIKELRNIVDLSLIKETDNRLFLDMKTVCLYFRINFAYLVDFLENEKLIAISKSGKPITLMRIGNKLKRCVVIDKNEFNKYI